jgi:sortase A
MSRSLRALSLLFVIVGAAQIVQGAWIPLKAVLAQALLERAWEQTQSEGERVRPWPWADTWPVARVTIPRLGASWIVLSGASGRTLAFAPGHTHGSALPGRPGTAIVSGHRDTHFRTLKGLRLGDEIEARRPDGGSVRYRVDDLRIADARKDRLVDTGTGRSLVLVTCWPFDSPVAGGPYRLVVTANEIFAPRGAAKGVVAVNPTAPIKASAPANSSEHVVTTGDSAPQSNQISPSRSSRQVAAGLRSHNI